VIRRNLYFVLVFLGLLGLPAAARAGFEIEPGSVSSTALNADGTIANQAGSHPFSYRVSFKFKLDGNNQPEGGEPRDIIVDLPPGLVGNPRAVPVCPRLLFEGIIPSCPNDTVIGVLEANLVGGAGQVSGPVFNLEAPPGVAGQIGFSVVNRNALQNASVRTEAGYGLEVAADNIPVSLSSATETIWGVPADSAHDSERGFAALGGHGPASSDAPLQSYLTLPASCTTEQKITVLADSKLNPGVFVERSGLALDAGGSPQGLSGCDSVPFSPSVAAAPTSASTEAATGLDFSLKLPNLGLLAPEGIAETEPEKTEVTLPTGVTVNPSAANGIVGCSQHQFEVADGEPGQGCPEASKIGTLVAKTPLLEEAIEGAVYLAQPHENKFDSLLALYIVASAGERGVLVKQAGEVKADPVTGQLTTSFDGLPPLPYSSFEFDLREGPRAPLVTPQACGNYETVAKLYPFSAPGAALTRTAPFKITSGSGGGNCVSGEAGMPNAPRLETGTNAPIAGAYSPFLFRLTRSDGQQRFSSVQATLPLGLLGKLAGVPYCSDGAIGIASARTQEGGGALENASPSCPAASQVGIVNVAAGAGSQPFYVQGKVFLAGPYKGAPISLEIITPAIAGPFDLGAVAVRTALDVDPFTAQIHAVSDPLPTILHGIPLDIRTVSLQMNRPNFTLNPTNCQAKTVLGQVASLTGQIASLQNHFQVGGCEGLKFKPELRLSLNGQTKRAGHPALKAVVTYPKGSGYANIARAQVGLPHSEFLDQGNIGTVCTQPQLRSGTCPKASIYGKATAYTPLLDKPLTGPVYLGVGFGHKLPDLVADLNGQIRILLHGKVDTDRQKGIRNTFEAVPDAPVSKFVLEMQGGKKGLLENSTNICKGSHKAEVRFTAQTGSVESFKTPVQASCKGKKNGKKR
jgi:hypothetical protein